MTTVALLTLSNVFMTAAWYGHLRYKHAALWKVVLASWLIAGFEYCLQVPANRWGHGAFTAAQLKVLQEAITLVVFVGFAWLWLGERLRWNEAAAFVLVFAAVAVANLPARRPAPVVATAGDAAAPPAPAGPS
jgi:uncharacterized protein (DUF486 family)